MVLGRASLLLALVVQNKSAPLWADCLSLIYKKIKTRHCGRKVLLEHKNTKKQKRAAKCGKSLRRTQKTKNDKTSKGGGSWRVAGCCAGEKRAENGGSKAPGDLSMEEKKTGVSFLVKQEESRMREGLVRVTRSSATRDEINHLTSTLILFNQG